MALFSRLRTNQNLSLLLKHRYLATSSILSSGSKTPLTSMEKTRAALSLLKSESNPEKILEICRAAALTPEIHLDRIVFSLAISKLSQANHFNGISQFLEDLKTRPDLRRDDRFICHSIVLYGQANMVDHAIRTFKEMDKHGFPHSVRALNALLFALTVAKDYKEVKRVFLEFPKAYGIEPDLDTYNKVIKAFCESGDSSSVYSILAEMDRKSMKPNAMSFGLLLTGFYKEQKFEDVGKVLKMTEKYGIKPGLSLHNTRIQSLCKLKRSAEGKALLDGMLSRGVKPNAITYSHLIHGFCREGNLEEAKKLFKTMINRGLKPESNCYFTLVYFLCQGGDYETALKICKASMEKGWVPSFTIMRSLINGLTGISKVAEAKELIGVVKEKFTRNVDLWNEIEAGLPQ
ncbi:Pentatricopeptide repeat-containing protein [Melia azedarach]|uniref:Pentatricopeptide repeat-containing protein n=2 Tax=Melia azedarach TaxID=155640 RepID=A0ACC1WVD8_MELAZ|nr:Pentatricopeptide repeat-containing protein [Melia azedarach]KAJ4703162.1 Pentatricopeptide repeat-containing protein [Melia azedarach]